MLIPGHYKEKFSNTENPVIIKIVGPDPNNEGKYLSIEGKTYSESNLVENYIPLVTAPTEESFKQSLNKSKRLFGDFKPITEENAKIFETIENHDKYDYVDNYQGPPVTETILETKIVQTPSFKETQEPEHEYKNILEKLNLTTINKQSQEKFGIPATKEKQTISLNLEIDLNYDIDKIKQTINILELDNKKVAEYLLSTIKLNTDILKLVGNEISKILTNEITKNDENKYPTFQVIHQVEKVEETQVIEPVIEIKNSSENEEILVVSEEDLIELDKKYEKLMSNLNS
jgi:hypothetical protein